MNRSRQTSGYTLIEMVLALAITSTLLLGMTASIVIASRTVSDGLDVVALALRTSDVLGEVNSDLSMAEAFVERTDSSVTFCVPDRDGDGQSDLLRYWWTGSTDKRLMKQVNGGPDISLAEDVHQFTLTYGLSTMAAETMTTTKTTGVGMAEDVAWVGASSGIIEAMGGAITTSCPAMVTATPSATTAARAIGSVAAGPRTMISPHQARPGEQDGPARARTTKTTATATVMATAAKTTKTTAATMATAMTTVKAGARNSPWTETTPTDLAARA